MTVAVVSLLLYLLLIAGGGNFCTTAAVAAAGGGKMNQKFDLTWGGDRGKFIENGNLLTLSMDRASGSGFQSRNMYMYGNFDIQMKLVPGNSAGTVTSYFLMSEKPESRDEIDLEFLGNLTGDPYTLHTNIYVHGKGDREQQFRLWFDPTKTFHTYSILWNPSTILISVDGIPVREFKNMESKGIPFPKAQPMRIYSSIYDADQWATRGGQVKTDWTKSPFTASYRNFNSQACVWAGPRRGSCSSGSVRGPAGWMRKRPDPIQAQKLKSVQRNFMIYNYCTDTKRFPRGFPPECRYMIPV